MDDIRPPTLLGRMSRGMRGISFQLAAVVSLAMLPVGLVAIWQSSGFAREARQSAKTLLLGMTEESVGLERRQIEAGLGIDPDFVAPAILAGSDQTRCIEALAWFIADHPVFRSVSFVPLDGASRCASDGRTRDLRNDATHIRFLARPVVSVDRIGMDGGGTEAVLHVLKPVHMNGTLLGYVSLVLQTLRLPPAVIHSGVPTPREVLLFNTTGNLLTSSLDLQGAASRLPSGAQLDQLLHGPDGFVENTDRSGRRSGFVKVALIPDAVLAIGIWPNDNPVSQTDHAWSKAVTFPLLLWLVSIATAMFATRRLVIRPIKMLRDEMRRFALGQRNAAIVLAPGAALEIQETVNTFNKLELIVARNEATLALTAEGKLLLLREVHHRIKNNLQMISSIISIQRRKTVDPEVEKVLRSLRDRVLSIAAVDQSLYTNGDVVDVRADLLIASISARLVGVNLEPGHGVRIMTNFEHVMLHADQIGPLSLLANEGVTNALKYVGEPEAGPPTIDIALSWDADKVHFSVINSLGSRSHATDSGRESTKLGMVLIGAFADQLDADLVSGVDASGLGFRLSVKFRPNGPVIGQNPAPDTVVNAHAAIADGMPL